MELNQSLCENCGIGIAQTRVFELKYTDSIVLLSEDPNKVQFFSVIRTTIWMSFLGILQLRLRVFKVF